MAMAGANNAQRLLQDLRGGSLSWDAAFDVEAGDGTFSHMIEMVSAHPDDIFTAKLAQTRSFFSAVKSGSVSILCPPHQVPDYTAALSVLTIILTHNRLARTGVAEMRNPGFWIMSKNQSRLSLAKSCDPVMPLSHLQTITGLTDAQLKACVAPLVRDGAIKVVKSTEGVVGLHIVDGISDESKARRFMRR